MLGMIQIVQQHWLMNNLNDDVSSISKHTAELVFSCELPDTAFFEEQVPCSATFSLPVGTLHSLRVFGKLQLRAGVWQTFFVKCLK